MATMIYPFKGKVMARPSRFPVPLMCTAHASQHISAGSGLATTSIACRMVSDGPLRSERR